jgi:crotonobetainyl-CoA:carnitine CoA-transferase CaiB-like acyl-CoA transferase
VLDLTNSIAGPYATQILGDLGAEVLKIERPDRGDDTRDWGPPFLDGQSLWFASVNRNKRSATIDLAAAEGRRRVEQLVTRADVVVSNFRPSVQADLGLDYEAVRALNSSVVFCSITGFGLTGRRKALLGYDLIAEGYSGVMDLTGEPGGPPQKIGAPAADLLAGMDAAMGVVSALFDRTRTGKGHLVDVALVDSMVKFVSSRLVSYMGSGELATRSGGRDSVIAVYQVFDTADQPMTLAIGNDAIFRRLCECLNRPGLLADPRFAGNTGRRDHRRELVDIIAADLKGAGRGHWLDLFSLHGVPAGPINRVDEVVDDDDLRARGLFYGIASGDTVVPQVGTGWWLDGSANGCRIAPPILNADRDAVADWLGAGDHALPPAETLGPDH